MNKNLIPSYLAVEDVMELLAIRKSKAYSIIKDLNVELETKGFLTIPGRVPKKYLLERFKLLES
jgi:gp27 protein